MMYPSLLHFPGADGTKGPMSFIRELSWRGLLQQTTDPGLEDIMQAGPMTLYAGFDPTADSLHVGSLVPILTLRRAQLAGHQPIALVGGATGMIGDPSGKTEERKLLSLEDLERNVAGIRRQLERFLDFKAGGAELVNNHDWFRGLGCLEFLRDVGKHFSVNMMLAKDSVRARIETREHGISYTEFSYMLVQAYDFLWLHDKYGCKLQVGGSDQWGNITAGIDLIRRLRQASAYGITLPLVTTASGQKFGKTERGTVWLDAERTSPYEFYQFFIQTDDRDVGRFLRFYTFLDERTILDLEESVRVAPEKREGHRVLAREVTTLVHGEEEARKAEEATQALFGRRGEGGSAVPASAPTSTESPGAFAGEGVLLVDLLVKTQLCPSKSAARREIAGGGIYLNEERVADAERRVGLGDVKEGKLLLRRGKKNYHVIQVAEVGAG
jgi:tyrosyl-tRNA synthetase